LTIIIINIHLLLTPVNIGWLYVVFS